MIRQFAAFCLLLSLYSTTLIAFSSMHRISTDKPVTASSGISGERLNNGVFGETAWQIHEGFLKAVDDLTREYDLPPGPDLYNHFLNNPDEFGSDGVHPNKTGSESIQRLWSEAVQPLYTSTATSPEKSRPSANRLTSPAVKPQIRVSCGKKHITAEYTGDALIITPAGRRVKTLRLNKGEHSLDISLPAGVYIMRYYNSHRSNIVTFSVTEAQ